MGIFVWDGSQVTISRTVIAKEQQYITIDADEQREIVEKWCKERPETVRCMLERKS